MSLLISLTIPVLWFFKIINHPKFAKLMKIFLSVTLAGLFFAFTASADPVFGVWKTQPGNEGNYAHVEIKECDGKICGEMPKAFDSLDKEI